MSEETRELAIRRILVALDTSSHSAAALQAAVNLAASFEAELMGLFVEDINLLRLASLPFVREVRSFSAAPQPLSSAGMEQELRLQASRARRALVSAAERGQVRWSFRIVRGQVAAEVMAAALEADLLALGKRGYGDISGRDHRPYGRPALRRLRLGSTARAAALRAPRSVLLMQHGIGAERPVLAVYDGSHSGRRALVAAAGLARANGAPLTVLLAARPEDETTSQAQKVSDWLKARGIAAEIQLLPGADQPSLVKAVQAADGGVLVLGGESQLVQGAALQSLLDEVSCPVMVVKNV